MFTFWLGYYVPASYTVRPPQRYHYQSKERQKLICIVGILVEANLIVQANYHVSALRIWDIAGNKAKGHRE